MTRNSQSRRCDGPTNRGGAQSQGLVEFALVLPILLVIIFVIIELARLLHAWLAIENGARFGVRYAVTGEFDPAQCIALYNRSCVTESEEDIARIKSIEDAANAGAVAILKDASVLNVGEPGFFKITVCSNKRDAFKNPLFQYRSSDPNTPLAAECLENATLLPMEDPGGPGDRVSVTIDFDHPIISPIISSVWPDLHLTAKREGIVERYRTARVVGLPATISGPSPTPSDTPTPSSTPTASNTPTPSSTPTASNTPTPSNTPTASDTPGPTSTPKPTKTPEPTKTPKPTKTPGPSPTPKPTKTPEPTNTPKPTKTAGPSPTPKSTNTPKPTKTPAPSSTAFCVDC